MLTGSEVERGGRRGGEGDHTKTRGGKRSKRGKKGTSSQSVHVHTNVDESEMPSFSLCLGITSNLNHCFPNLSSSQKLSKV